jgi:prepilin-type N-terminal cleavage/methylation domain-containing protein
MHIPSQSNNTSQSKGKIKNSQAGFTLVELLVVLIIFIIIGFMSFFRYKSNEYKAYLDGLANDITLSIRQAQVYATAVRQYHPPAPTSPTFDVAYGVAFGNSSGESDGYIFFAKLPESNNGVITYAAGFDLYQPGAGFLYNTCLASDGCIQRTVFRKNYQITSGTLGMCDSTISTFACDNRIISHLTVMFRKGSSTPVIVDDVDALTPRSYAQIRIFGPGNKDYRTIKIHSDGTTEVEKGTN